MPRCGLWMDWLVTAIGGLSRVYHLPFSAVEDALRQGLYILNCDICNSLTPC